MAASLTEETLTELEAAVRAELKAHPEEYEEEAAIMLALLASARAVRNVEAAIRELRAEYRLGPVKRKDGTDATPVDLPRHLLDRIEAALTATAEPTAGEER